jgi:YVTN family beta-propeller protein
VLEAHQRILRGAFAAHDGREIDTQGDSFFVAFPRARDAIQAAVDAQKALAVQEWPDDVQVRVRMGLHSGDPIVASEGYTGIGVHRAARISAAGHGGQVLLSSATRELVRDDLPEGMQLRDLGAVRLKDLDEPERIYQLQVDGLAWEFPRLKSYGSEPLYRRTPVLAGAGIVAAAIVAAALLLGAGSSEKPITAKPNSLVAIDPKTNKVVGQTSVGTIPGPMTYAAGSLWVGNIEDRTISRVNPKTLDVIRSIQVKEIPDDLTTVAGAPWIGGQLPGENAVSVRRLDPQFNSLGRPTRIGNVVPGGDVGVEGRGNELYAAPNDGLITKIDPSTGKTLRSVDVRAQNWGLTLDNDVIWTASGDGNTVTRVDANGLVTPITVGHSPIGLAIGGGSVWVSDRLDDTVTRIDPATNSVKSTTPVGRSPGDIAFGDGSIWAANHGSGTVSRIDAKTGKVIATIHVGQAPNSVLFAGGRVWVTVERKPPAPPANVGGTLRITAENGPGPLDPALAFNDVAWQLMAPMCVKLLNYPDASGAKGSVLHAEAAEALPAISRDGRTYTFHIRKGYRFSPPSNQPVTAAVFKYSIERSLNSKMKGFAKTLLGDIAGEDAFLAGKARGISGIRANGDTLTIELRAPGPDLPVRLTLPFFGAVPVGTPLDPRGVEPIPMAGPYYEKDISGDQITLMRNPNYRGARPRRVERIDFTSGVGRARSARMIIKGAADLSRDAVSPTTFKSMLARYGGKPRARHKGPLLLARSLPAVQYAVLNFTRPLFRDVRMRQAVNYAIDRTAFAPLGTPGQPLAADPNDQILPPGIPGYRPVEIYPNHPDLAKARALAGGGRHRAVLYNCNIPACRPFAQLLTTQLAKIGIEVETKELSFNQLYARAAKPGEPYDIAFQGWLADYADPYDFLNALLLDGADVEPPFTDPRYAGRLRAAARLSGPKRYLAYAKLDEEITRDAAPWAAINNTLVYDFVGPRVGCLVSQPLYGLDLAAACLKKPKT